MSRPAEDAPVGLCTVEELVAELFCRPLFRGVLVRLAGDTRRPAAGPSVPHLVSRAGLSRAGAVALLTQTAAAIDHKDGP